jgi:hypothetical protein
MNELVHSSGKKVTAVHLSGIICKSLKNSRFPSCSDIKKDIVPIELCLFSQRDI